jgi:PIN domain nuclease of toxin-antitoxin system
MTREEAHKAALYAKAQWDGGSSEGWLINCLVAFGVLKLDEPPSTNEQFRSAVSESGVHLSELTIKSALEKSGLKLVPRSPQDVSDG